MNPDDFESTRDWVIACLSYYTSFSLEELNNMTNKQLDDLFANHFPDGF